MTTKQITLYVWKNNCQTVRGAVQGEVNSRFLEITLEDNLGPVDLNNKSVQLYAQKPDGNLIYNNAEIMDSNKGIVLVGLTSEMSAVPGVLRNCEVRVVDLTDKSVLKFNGLNIVISTGMDDLAIESTSEFTALQQAISRYDELNAEMQEHLINTENPHSITAEQISAAKLNSNGKFAGDYIEDSSITASKISDAAITTVKIASGASIDKWKNWSQIESFTELGLDESTCTMADIMKAMPAKSYLVVMKSNSYKNSNFPANSGLLRVWKFNANISQAIFENNIFYADTNTYFGTYQSSKGWSGWKKVYADNDLIPLTAITTRKIQDNLFVAENCIVGGYYTETNGIWTTSSSVTTTEIMPAVAGEKLTMYTHATSPNHIITFWDADGNFLCGFKRLPDDDKCMRFMIPKGASGFRCSFVTSNKPYIQIGHEYIQQDNLDEYVKSVNNDFFKGKKMNCLGDSITYGYIPGSGSQMSRPYPTVVKELLGLDTVRNYGISGSTLAINGQNPMVTRYADMDDDADIICVFGGTNDWGKSSDSQKRPLGTLASTDNTTVYGALNELCSGLITKYPKSTIFLITPLHRTNDTTANIHGYVLADVATAIKEVGNKFGIPVLDLFSSGNFYPTNSTQNTNCSGDGLHPNQWYHENVLARKIAKFIKTII